MAANSAQVIRELGGNWLECQDSQGTFYFNSETQESSEAFPGSLMGQPAVQQHTESHCPPKETSGAQPFQQNSLERMRLGDWIVCEDNMGVFYHHALTGQQFNEPPAELLQLYHEHRAREDARLQQQLEQIQVQKEQLDQRMLPASMSKRKLVPVEVEHVSHPHLNERRTTMVYHLAQHTCSG